MLLPTVAIVSDPFTDVSGNQNTIVGIGEHYYETTPVLKFTGGRAFLVNSPDTSTTNFTVEFRGQPTSATSSAIYTTRNFGGNVPGQIGLYINTTQVLLYLSIVNEYELLTSFTIPEAVQGKTINVALTRNGNTYRLYLNGELKAITVRVNDVPVGGCVLLGRLHENERQVVQGYQGTVEYLRVHDGFALPVELLESIGDPVDRSYALSVLDSYVFQPSDLQTKYVASLKITPEAFFAKYTTGQLFAIARQRPGAPGVVITNLEMRGTLANQLWVTLSDGQSFLVGVQEAFTSSEAAEFPAGTGYLITDGDVKKFVPFNVTGDGLLKTKPNGLILSTTAVSPLAYDEASVIILQESITSALPVQPVGAAGAWVTRPYSIKAGAMADYTVSAAGNVILPVGVYRIVGTHVSQTTRCLARLYDLTSSSAMLTSTPSLSASTPGNKYFDGVFTGLDAVEVVMQTMNTTATTALNQPTTLLNPGTVFSEIKIYKVE